MFPFQAHQISETEISTLITNNFRLQHTEETFQRFVFNFPHIVSAIKKKNHYFLVIHRRKESPLSENLGEETGEMESAKTERRDQQKTGEKKEKSPTQAELDDFFSAAERNEQKRFTEK